MFFKAAHRGGNEFWMYLITIALFALGYIVGQIPMLGAIYYKISTVPEVTQDTLMQFQENPDFTLFGIDSNVGFILLIMMFVFATLGLWIGIKFLHKKKFLDIITPHEEINWNKIFWGFGVWMILGMFFEGISYAMSPENYSFQFDLMKFIPLVLIGFLLLPIQTSCEEFMFRGYLMQMFGLISKNKWVPILMTSILFASIHMMNPEVSEYGIGIMFSYYMAAGLVLAIMTVMDDSIELALGVHAATNIYGALFLSYDGAAIQTATIFKSENMDPTFMLIIFIVMSIVFLLLACRKYNWTSFSKLFESTQIENEIV